MASERTAEWNCKQAMYPGSHLLSCKIWYKRYDQYSDLKQSKECIGSQILVHSKHHCIFPTSILQTMVHHKHSPYHAVTLQTSESLPPSPVAATGGQP